MRSRTVACGVWCALLLLAACGDDDTTTPVPDGGMSGEGGGGAGGSAAGHGGSGGSGGKPAGGSGGSSGQSAGGEGGSNQGGQGGSSGSGGSGGSSGGETYNVGGTVSGLNGSGLVLKNNGGDNLSVSANGSFKFQTKLASGAGYAVTVGTQPSNPGQTCTVTNGSGNVGSADVTNVTVACTDLPPNTYHVGGSVTGLSSATLKLKNNGGDELTISADGTFMFSTALHANDSYSVTVSSVPSGYACGVANASGTIASSDITNVAVNCHANPTLLAIPRVASARLTWTAESATHYNVFASSDAQCNFDNYQSCTDGAMFGDVTSPYLATGLDNGKTYYFQLRAVHDDGVTAISTVSGARPGRAIFDAPVKALAVGSNAIYLGGSFSSIGPYMGTGVPIDKTSAAPSGMPNFPMPDNIVNAAVSDGNGGFYLGGAFTNLGSTARNHLAHVLADGSVDPAFDPNPNGTVTALALSGSTLYVAGSFTMIESGARHYLAALTLSPTLALADWNPNPDGAVSQLVAANNQVYVGGSFDHIGSTPAASHDLAVVDASGAAVTGFSVTSDDSGGTLAIAVRGTNVYVSGYFSTINGQTRGGLAELDSSGTVTGWDPNPNQPVNAMLLANDTLYLGGQFTMIDGQTRNHLAAFDNSDMITSWDPNADAGVNTLAAIGSAVYAGGSFSTIGTSARGHLAAIDASGQATAWDPEPNADVSALGVSGDTIYVSGANISTFAPDARHHLAAFSTSGALTSWSVAADGDVDVLALDNTTLYVGGEFGQLGSSTRNGIGAVGTDGTVSTWYPQADTGSKVYALALSDSRVYIGGAFSMIANQSRANLAALARTDAGVAAWNPNPDGDVLALALDGTTLYVGGKFSNANATARGHLAAYDTSNDMLISGFAPSASGNVDALTVVSNILYAGGAFTMIDSTARSYLAALDATGALQAWNPQADGEVTALANGSAGIFAAGAFGNIGSDGRLHLAAIDANGAALAWNNNTDGTVTALATDADNLYAGGDFTAIGGNAFNDFATLPQTQ